MTTNTCIIFWDFLMLYQIFLSLQVKRCAVITYKHGIYELPHKLLKEKKTKKVFKNKNQNFPAVRYFTWKLELVSNILWMITATTLATVQIKNIRTKNIRMETMQMWIKRLMSIKSIRMKSILMKITQMKWYKWKVYEWEGYGGKVYE